MCVDDDVDLRVADVKVHVTRLVDLEVLVRDAQLEVRAVVRPHSIWNGRGNTWMFLSGARALAYDVDDTHMP